MIAQINIHEKSYGDKMLYQDFALELRANEKVGLIGRNGTGKTTLFNMVTGSDTDFAGDIDLRKGLVLASSRQEHHGFENTPILEYILDDLPEYAQLKHALDTFSDTTDHSMKKLHDYSENVERFTTLGYFMVEEEIVRSLESYQLSLAQIQGTLGKLSGGQKRFVELVKVQHARANLALIDEPTNHMDYVAKEVFIDWFKQVKEAVLVITHDRDVLRQVDRMVEIRDGQAFSFKGNYDDYLRTNATKIVSEVNEYSVVQRRIANLKDDIVRFRRLKERSRDPGTIHRFKSLQTRAETELVDLQSKDKPSFWIDRESAQGLNNKMSEAYEEHKSRNIKIRARTAVTKSNHTLIETSKLSLGYDQPLFDNVSFQLREGDRLRLHGRNGAGKTTLVKAILAAAHGTKVACKVFGGEIVTAPELKIGVYDQEIDAELLPLPLGEAIEQAFMQRDIKINDQKIRQLLSDYLFNPITDSKIEVGKLSGGQKARFQLIQMLADDPQVLILDEPTNHLDLPSIEEIEDALKQYHGAILYISHDSYFVHNLGGDTVKIGE